MKRRSKLLLVASVSAPMALAAGLSWACTVAAGVSMSQNSGPAGVSVTITGKTFAPGPVEIRWNSTEGPVIATAEGPDFSVQAAPPVGVRPDVYYLVAIQTVPEGTFKASETFEVTGASVNTASADVWSGFSSKGSTPSSLAETPATSGGSIPAGGVGLLAVGLAGLATAASVPAVRSMKARASARR